MSSTKQAAYTGRSPESDVISQFVIVYLPSSLFERMLSAIRFHEADDVFSAERSFSATHPGSATLSRIRTAISLTVIPLSRLPWSKYIRLSRRISSLSDNAIFYLPDTLSKLIQFHFPVQHVSLLHPTALLLKNNGSAAFCFFQSLQKSILFRLRKGFLMIQINI